MMQLLTGIKMVKRFTIAVLAILIIVYSLSCSFAHQPSTFPKFITKIELRYYQETTFEEAIDTLGATLPKPTYLPKGLKIEEVYINYNPEGRSTVILVISDEPIEKRLVTYTDQWGSVQQGYELECNMRMQIRWIGGKHFMPIKPPPGQERVKVKGRTGVIKEGETVNSLLWQIPRFELVLSMSKDVPKEELIEVAESVRLYIP